MGDLEGVCLILYMCFSGQDSISSIIFSMEGVSFKKVQRPLTEWLGAEISQLLEIFIIFTVL